jgi:hypothetical protein
LERPGCGLIVIYLSGGAGECASLAVTGDFHEASEEVDELDEDFAPVGSVSHCSMTGSGPRRARLKRLEAGLMSGQVEGCPVMMIARQLVPRGQ